MLYDIRWKLNTGSLSIKTDSQPPQKAKNLMMVIFQTMTANIKMYAGDTVWASFGLKGMECIDGATPGTLYPNIIRAKEKKDDGYKSLLFSPYFSFLEIRSRKM